MNLSLFVFVVASFFAFGGATLFSFSFGARPGVDDCRIDFDVEECTGVGGMMTEGVLVAAVGFFDVLLTVLDFVCASFLVLAGLFLAEAAVKLF